MTTTPATKRVTKVRSVVVPDEIWEDVEKLAGVRHSNISEQTRRALLALIAEARNSGEMPKTKRTRKVVAA